MKPSSIGAGVGASWPRSQLQPPLPPGLPLPASPPPPRLPPLPPPPLVMSSAVPPAIAMSLLPPAPAMSMPFIVAGVHTPAMQVPLVHGVPSAFGVTVPQPLAGVQVAALLH